MRCEQHRTGWGGKSGKATLVATTVVCLFAVGRYAAALDLPPDPPDRQRDWLSKCLLADMDATERMTGPDKVFDPRARARVRALVRPAPNARGFEITSNDEVAQLAEYYYRTRTRAEEDVRECRRQLVASQSGSPIAGQAASSTPEEREAERADRDAIATLGGTLAGKDEAVCVLAQLIGASLPGFVVRQTGLGPPLVAFDGVTGSVQYAGPGPDAIGSAKVFAFGPMSVSSATLMGHYVGHAGARGHEWHGNSVAHGHEWHGNSVARAAHHPQIPFGPGAAKAPSPNIRPGAAKAPSPNIRPGASRSGNPKPARTSR